MSLLYLLTQIFITSRINASTTAAATAKPEYTSNSWTNKSSFPLLRFRVQNINSSLYLLALASLWCLVSARLSYSFSSFSKSCMCFRFSILIWRQKEQLFREWDTECERNWSRLFSRHSWIPIYRFCMLGATMSLLKIPVNQVIDSSTFSQLVLVSIKQENTSIVC